jgi:hypothetical protein
MAFGKGDHVVFEGFQVVGQRRHIFRLDCIPEANDLSSAGGGEFVAMARYRWGGGGFWSGFPCATLTVSRRHRDLQMLLSKEYVGYLAREVSKKLIAGEFIETKSVPVLAEKLNAAMLEEFGLEDRINDEVRVILEAYSEEMRRSGANYQEMFRKVKSELVRKYKAVL